MDNIIKSKKMSEYILRVWINVPVKVCALIKCYEYILVLKDFNSYYSFLI